MNKLMIRKNVLILWGLFDVLYVAWFVAESLKKGRIPYITDAMSMIEVAGDVGGFFPAFGVFMSFVFQLSIILTACLLIFQHSRAKILCYIQIPFRLFFIVPSVSVILIATGYLGEYNVGVVLGLVVASEILKGFTLWKFT